MILVKVGYFYHLASLNYAFNYIISFINYLDKPVTAGCGSKETQFQGSVGKGEAKKEKPVNILSV